MLMERALEPHVLLGMPHLNAHGLSETWLMKELGHRHWLLLALRFGMENADFRTPDGGKAYASICATSLRDARLGIAAADDVLTIRSSLVRISRTQWSSRHRLSIRDMAIGEVELVSAFVHRMIEGDNRSLARVGHWDAPVEVSGKSELAAFAASFRRGTASGHLGMSPPSGPEPLSYRFQPSLREEFNGAGLFYFAEFQAIANRAFETRFPEAGHAFSRRDVFFTGNIVPGEIVTVHIGSTRQMDSLRYTCKLVREDGEGIAFIFIEAAEARESGMPNPEVVSSTS